jgi:hypothetical protein
MVMQHKQEGIRSSLLTKNYYARAKLPQAKGVLRRISVLGRKVIGTQDFQMDGLIPRTG